MTRLIKAARLGGLLGFLGLLLVYAFESGTEQTSADEGMSSRSVSAHLPNSARYPAHSPPKAATVTGHWGGNPFAALDCSPRGGFIQNSSACMPTDEEADEAETTVGTVVSRAIEKLSPASPDEIYEINGGFASCTRALIHPQSIQTDEAAFTGSGCRTDDLSRASAAVEAKLAAMSPSPAKDQAMVAWLFSRWAQLSDLAGLSPWAQRLQADGVVPATPPGLQAQALIESRAMHDRLVAYLERTTPNDSHRELLEILTHDRKRAEPE